MRSNQYLTNSNSVSEESVESEESGVLEGYLVLVELEEFAE